MLYNKMLKSDLVELIEDKDIQLESANSDTEYWIYESNHRDAIIANLKEQIIDLPVCNNMAQQIELEDLLASFKQKHNL